MPTLEQITAASAVFSAVLAGLPECSARTHAEAHHRTTLRWARSALDRESYIDELHTTVAAREQVIAAHTQTIEELKAQLEESAGPVE